MEKFFDLQRFVEIVSLTSGDDYIDNKDSDKIIYALAGKDKGYNHSENVTIFGGKNDDDISNLSDEGNVVIFGDEDDDRISSFGEKNVTLFGGIGDDYLWNQTDYAKIFGESGNDYLYSSNENVTMSGGEGKDTLYSSLSENVLMLGGAGNDSIRIRYGKRLTVSGGTGNDIIELRYDHYDYEKNILIQYEAGDGDDTIIGFGSDDTLQISSGSFTTTKSDDGIIIKIGSGSITLNNPEEETLNIVTVSGGNDDDDGGNDDSGDEDTLPSGLSLDSKGTTMTASKKFKGSSIDLTDYPKVKTLNASAVTQKLTITGNTLANKISSGSGNDTISGGKGNDSILGNAGNDKLLGENGNDTLTGGAGNDTLTGGKGADVFVHTKGKDVITDYQTGQDTIYLDNSYVKSWKVSGKNVIFTTETGTITVNNGKGKNIIITSSKTYSSSSALFEENNFATADNLSEIVAEKSVGEIEFTNSEKISQENLITYAEK